MQSSPAITLSANELQLRDFEMGRSLSARIVEAADQIRAQSPDPAVRRNAMLWKISAIPLVNRLGSVLRGIAWQMAIVVLFVITAALGSTLILIRRWRAAAP